MSRQVITQLIIMINVLKTIKKTAFNLCILSVILGLIIIRTGTTADKFYIDEDVLKRVEEKYGRDARERLISWESLIRQGQGKQDMERLNEVNSFFNRTLSYAEDIRVWGVNDYWATPLEFLSLGAGDCEDYAIAKYFTLKAMGVSEEKLNIAYVKAIGIKKPHMVLTYYSKPVDEPLILDNLINTIKPSSQRNDLLPIFSFNGSGLWMAQQRGRGNMTASSRLKKWKDLLTRMSENRF